MCMCVCMMGVCTCVCLSPCVCVCLCLVICVYLDTTIWRERDRQTDRRADRQIDIGSERCACVYWKILNSSLFPGEGEGGGGLPRPY